MKYYKIKPNWTDKIDYIIWAEGTYNYVKGVDPRSMDLIKEYETDKHVDENTVLRDEFFN